MNIYNDYENDQSQALKSTMNRFTHIICISDPQIMATEQANKIQDCTQNDQEYKILDSNRIVLTKENKRSEQIGFTHFSLFHFSTTETKSLYNDYNNSLWKANQIIINLT